MSKNGIKVAIAGIGSLTSAFIQGIKYIEMHPEKNETLRYPILGGNKITDIEVVAAFDVCDTKVGKDISEAIFSPINSTPKFIEVEPFNIKVKKGPVKDGITGTLENAINIAPGEEVDMVKELKKSEAEILICCIPTGSNEAVETYAEAAIEADVAFINCTPTYIASKPEWAKRFQKANVALVGDDLQSMHGGTVLHKGLLEVMEEQGIKVIDTYQLDVAGGLETLNTLDDDRKAYKRHVKERTIQKATKSKINIASGTSDYLEFLGNRRIGHFWVYGEGFLGMPIKMDIRYETLDGPNGAATLIDVVRATKVAINRADFGPLVSVSAYGFKAPAVLTSRHESIKWLEDYIEGKRAK